MKIERRREEKGRGRTRRVQVNARNTFISVGKKRTRNALYKEGIDSINRFTCVRSLGSLMHVVLYHLYNTCRLNTLYAYMETVPNRDVLDVILIHPYSKYFYIYIYMRRSIIFLFSFLLAEERLCVMCVCVVNIYIWWTKNISPTTITIERYVMWYLWCARTHNVLINVEQNMLCISLGIYYMLCERVRAGCTVCLSYIRLA